MTKYYVLFIYYRGTFTMTSSSINNATVVRDIHWLNEQCVAYVTYSGKVQVFDTRNSNVVSTLIFLKNFV